MNPLKTRSRRPWYCRPAVAAGWRELFAPPGRPRYLVRLLLEQLEDMTLPSGSLSGSIWNDFSGDGLIQPVEPALAGWVAYLDLNHNGLFDTVTSTAVAPSTDIGIAPGALGSFGGEMSVLQAQGLAGSLTNLGVTLDLANTGTTAVVVAVISPVGLTVPNLPTLFTIRPGEHFVGTFDGNSTNAVATAPRPLPPGTYAPEQAFATPLSYINGTNPNGTWGLVFFGDTSGLDLRSWALTFTTLEPTATTDAQGNYSFQGLAAGNYDVRPVLSTADVQITPAGGAARSVQVLDGQNTTGVNFGVRPAPDLTAVAFGVSQPAAAWGEPVTVTYTITNEGAGAAGPFDVDIRLSADGRIDPSGPLLRTLHFDGLAAHATVSGSVALVLPGLPPPGFDPTPVGAYLGVLIDPLNGVAEADETDNANQGAGLDLVLVDGTNGVRPNTPVAAGSKVQQDPVIAANPTNPAHLVTAFLDYSLTASGYAGVGVASSFDGGATWTRGSVPLPTGFDQGAAAPTVVFDASGRVYVSFMAATFLGVLPTLTNPDSAQRLRGFTANNGVFVASSADGGRSWGTPVAVASNLYGGTDKVPFETFPAMAVDTSPTLAGGAPNPNFGSLYVAWSRFYPPGQFPGQPNSTSGSDVMLATSRDGGLTWQTQTQTDPATGLTRSVILDPRFKDTGTGGEGRGFVTFPAVTVGAGGDVYVSTYAGGNFTVYHSADGGRSFTPPFYEGQTGLAFPTITTNIGPAPTLFPDNFRTLPLRPIVADPSRPGRVYAVATNVVAAQVGPQAGFVIDPGDVIFASSDDFGQTWTSNFTVLKVPPPADRLTPAQIATYAPTLNDDNAGEPAGIVQDISTQVLAGQAMPSLTVDANGNVAVVWYDTRTDPNGLGLTVWGTVSTDGGQTFRPNFRITDSAFDPNAGAFRSGNGGTSFYLGDHIGVVVVGNTAYAVWTDTRSGGQDVFLGSYSVYPAPAGPVDRFAPNTTLETATDLGPVNTPKFLPRLALPPGPADEWFRLQAAADGELVVTVQAARPGGDLHVEITDETGNVLDATATNVLDANGGVIGVRLARAGDFGTTYLVHVFGTNAGPLAYTAKVSNLTGDLGPQVQAVVATSLSAGGQNAYRLAAAVAGTLTVGLTPGAGFQGDMIFVVLTPDAVNLLGQGDTATPVSIPVTQGQEVLVLVFGATGPDQGPFTFNVTNPDQYATAGGSTLFLPTTGGPASVAVADFNGDGIPDLLATSTETTDAVNVFLGNGDGTFRAPRQFDVGAGLRGGLTADNRQPVVLDVNRDGIPDAVVPNFRSADVSVLLGRGDGTFDPHRRFDAVTSPDYTATGDFDGNGTPDLIVLQNFPQLGSASQLAVLLGRGDGNFSTPLLYPTAFTNGAGPVTVGDFTGDGKLDLLVVSKNTSLGQLYRGNGDGSFTDSGTFQTPENAFNVLPTDLDRDGALDLVFTGTNSGNVYTALGNDDGTFLPAQQYVAMVAQPGDNVGVYGVEVVDFRIPDTAPLPFPPTDLFGVQLDYGPRSMILTAASRSGLGAAQVLFIPELVYPDGSFAGFAPTAVPLAQVGKAGDLATGDFDGDGATDVAVADAAGVTVVFGRPLTVPANDSAATARNLAAIVHYVTPTLSIVEGHSDAYYRFTVPVETVAGAGDQVIDVSALFEYEAGPGLRMEVLDQNGFVLGSGPRVRIAAAQGTELTIRVFGRTAAGQPRGSGAYTLDIDVLPQIVSAQATAFLPGGPATSIVLTLQGDRLDPATAENPAGYTVTWLGPNGETRVIPVGSVGGGQPVVYNPGANAVTSSGLTYPTAVRQTITLLFAEPLPAGSYRIDLAGAVQTAAFSPGEATLLAGGAAFGGHPVVTLNVGTISVGGSVTAANLVGPGGAPGDLSEFTAGTPFLTQLQNDLGALLDSMLRAVGDDPSVTTAVMNQILARLLPGLDPAFQTPILVLWLDPVSINLADSEGSRTVYNENARTVSSGMRNTFVEVGGNVELVVVAAASGTFSLNVGSVDAAARGGGAVLGAGGLVTTSLTDALRAGVTNFTFTIPTLAGAPTPGPTDSPGTGGPGTGNPDGSGVANIGRGGGAGGTGGGGNTAAATLINLLLLGAVNPGLAAGDVAAGGAGAGGASGFGDRDGVGGLSDVGSYTTMYGVTFSGPVMQALARAFDSVLSGFLNGRFPTPVSITQGLLELLQGGWLQQIVEQAAGVQPANNEAAAQGQPVVDVMAERAVAPAEPAAGAAPAVAPMPKAVPVPVPAAPAVPAVPTGGQQSGIETAPPVARAGHEEAVPAVQDENAGPDEGPARRVTVVALTSAVLLSFLAAHVRELTRPGTRDRAREPYPDETEPRIAD